MKRVGVVIVAGLMYACGRVSQPVEPSMAANIAASGLMAVVGTWTGSETATKGESGTLSVTFTQAPSLPDGALSATLTWTSARTALVYTGTLSGTISNMQLQATNNPGGASVCQYTATGSVNSAGNQMAGTYTGVGPAPCPTKVGSFVLNGQSLSSCAAVTYSGPNPFTLPNSSDATELEYVRAHVLPTLTGPIKVDGTGATTWTSDGDYPVVIVKAATVWFIYTNVHTGDVLQSPATNQNGQKQAISHVSRFRC